MKHLQSAVLVICLLLLAISGCDRSKSLTEAEAIDRLRSFGATFLTFENEKLSVVNGHSSFDDEAMALLGNFESVGEVVLLDSPITSLGIRSLGNRETLRRLDLWNAAIQDDAIKLLEGYNNLEYLDLSYTSVSDRSVNSLIKLKSLSKIYLEGSEITESGIKMLRAARPEIEIDY